MSRKKYLFLSCFAYEIDCSLDIIHTICEYLVRGTAKNRFANFLFSRVGNPAHLIMPAIIKSDDRSMFINQFLHDVQLTESRASEPVYPNNRPFSFFGPEPQPVQKNFLGRNNFYNMARLCLLCISFHTVYTIPYTRYFPTLRSLLPACEVILLLRSKGVNRHAH